MNDFIYILIVFTFFSLCTAYAYVADLKRSQ